MAVVGELLVLIGANGAPLTAGLAKAEGELKGFGASGTSALMGIRIAAAGVGVAAVAGMGIAVGAASSFQEQMAIINTIAHQTGPELAKTGDGIRAMATASGTPLSDLTTAYYDLLSAGIKPGADAMAMLGQANTLAIGGLATTAQTVDLLTTAVNVYGLNAKGAAVATDQFALAVQDGKVTADEIAATFADVGPLARTAGVGVDEIAASYAVLTASGVKAPEAMTQMNRAMVELIKPGKELSTLQKQMGVNFADIAKDKGLVVALQMMRDGAEKNNIPFANLFGRIEGMKFALATTGPHFKEYTGELEKMHHANGTAADQAAERSQTFTRQVSILGASFNDLAISVGTGLLPPLTDFVKHLSSIIQGIKAWTAANPGLASAILPVAAAVSGLVVAGLTLGPILGAIGTVITIITSPILLVGAAILGLAAHFGLLGADAKAAFNGIANTVLGTLGRIANQIPAQLATWARAFVAWVASVLPGFVAALQRMGLELVRWVIAKIPDLLAALVEFGAIIGRWIIGTGVPALANVMVQMGRAFVQWVRDAGPGVVADLIAWWSQVAAWLGTLPEKLLTAGLELGRALAKGIIDAIGDVPNQVGQTLSKIPGVSLVGDAGNAVGGAVGGAGSVLGGIANALPHFAQGGVVPGYGPQLAVVHGGETVTPAGGRQTVINHTTVLQIGDEKIAQMFERLLYNTSSTYSSGFADSPVGVR